jgi:hypothetical protein
MSPLNKRRALLVCAATSAVAIAVFAPPVEAGPVPQPLTLSVAGTNGVDRIQDPGRRCADGGSGEYRHASIEAQLPTSPTAVISASLPGVVRGSFDVHHDGTEIVGQPVSPAAHQAFLQGSESHVTMSNQRGSVQLRLTSGSCTNETLSYDGTTVSGAGAWTIDPTSTTGSYRQATGSGTFTLNLGVAPGADNPWNLGVNGNITVLQPHLKVEVVDTNWGNLGVDYVTRRPTVTYRITNTGPGDTFAPKLVSADSPNNGVNTLGVVPQNLPDLQSGQSTIVSVRYQLALLGGPCALVILGCQFDTTLGVSMPDALDKADSPPPTATVHVRTPDLPPPLA